jgi:hypothetical protein
MGNQTSTGGSEDSSDDHVYMIPWTSVPGVDNLVLDFLVDLVVTVVQPVYLFSVPHQRCFSPYSFCS